MEKYCRGFLGWQLQKGSRGPALGWVEFCRE
jgi:hypothetical protein